MQFVCDKCHSSRLVEISGKCVGGFDLTSLKDGKVSRFIPESMGIGHGEELEFDLCLSCGQIQGVNFPVPDPFLDSEE